MIADRLKSDRDFARQLGKRIFGKDVGSPVAVLGGGSNAKQIEDIFGGSTNGKPDLSVRWDDLPIVNLSIKKSLSGQVFLTSVERFVVGYEYHFSDKVPLNVEKMLHLFIGTDGERCDLVMRGRNYLGPVHHGGDLQEKHQHRILAVTLSKHFPKDWRSTLDWVQLNAGRIAEFSFSRGYARNQVDFATHLWYFSGDKCSNAIDCLIPVREVVKFSNKFGSESIAGPKNGGSTIQFPFGFLQMHAPKGENLLQIHHQFKKLGHLGL